MIAQTSYDFRVPTYRSADSNAALTAILAFPYLRSVIDPQYRSLPADDLEALVDGQLGEGSADEYEAYLEGLFGDAGRWISHAATDVGRAAVTAAPYVANVGGGVIRGATAGASLGLPGIIGGAVVGGVGQGFASYGSGTLRDVGQGLNAATNIAGQFSGTGRIGASLGGALSDVGRGKNVLGAAAGAASGIIGGAGGGGAALGGGSGLASALTGLAGGRAGGIASLAGMVGGGRPGAGGAGSGLMALLGRPEMMQALGAMGLGSLGARSVPVGNAGTPVPASAFANLLSLFAQSVADEQATYSDGGEGKIRYLLDDNGEWAVDPAEPRERAVHLARLLDAAQDERVAEDQLELQAQRSQELQRQADLLQSHQTLIDRLQAARVRQAALAREAEMLDAVELAEAAVWTEVDEGIDEGVDEASDEADLELDELDEALDEYDDILSA